MEKTIQINVDKLKSVLRDAIGKDNAVNKATVMRKCFDGYNDMTFLEKAYASTILGRMLSYLRKNTDYFVVSTDGELYVPTTNDDLTPYVTRMGKVSAGMKKGIARAEKYVAEKKFRNLG